MNMRSIPRGTSFAGIMLVLLLCAHDSQAQERMTATTRVQVNVEDFATVMPRSLTVPLNSDGEATIEITYSTNRPAAQSLYVRAEGTDSLHITPLAIVPINNGHKQQVTDVSSIGEAKAIIAHRGDDLALINGIVAVSAKARVHVRPSGDSRSKSIRLHFTLR
jgi:hypothetical protein